MRTRHHFLLTLVLVIPLVSMLIPPATYAQSDQRCFAETGFCISSRIREFWEQNGGLAVFGFPTTAQHEAEVEGRSMQLQWFERNRLELHPENARPYDVLLGRLGADRLAQQGRDWFAFPKSDPQPGCRSFPETGHQVCGDILAFWRSQGLRLDSRPSISEAESLALFGLPLSDVMTETFADGTTVQAQWFERARIELHPENQPPYHVQLGLLGNEIRAAGSAPSPAQPPAAPADCPGVPTPTDSTLSAACVRGGDAFEMVGRGFQPGERITFFARDSAGAQRDIVVIAGYPKAQDDGHYYLKAALRSGIAPGIYTVVIHGRKSGHDALAPLAIAAGPPSGPDQSILPPSVNVRPSPEVGQRGARFIFDTDLPPYNRVGVYLTDPFGQVIGADFTIGTDASGNVGSRLGLQTDDDTPYGLHVATFEVLGSGEKAFAYLRVVPEP